MPEHCLHAALGDILGPLLLLILLGSLAKSTRVSLFTCAELGFNAELSEVNFLCRDSYKTGGRLPIRSNDTGASAMKFVPGGDNVWNGL